jgi:hypothetical protein
MKQMARILLPGTLVLISTLLLTISWQAASAQAPTITGFTPATGAAGTLVTITGTDLSNPQTLTIGGTNAVVVSNDGTTLVAMVMPGSTTGTIAVTTAGGTATSASTFVTQKSGYTFAQQNSKLVGTGSAGFSRQGQSVAVSADGNTAVVGGPSDNTAQGAVWIFTRSSGVWSQQGTKLVGTGNTGAARQGTSVAISADGNTVLVGGEADNSNLGAAWVFTRSGGVWTQQGTKLVGTGIAAGFTAYFGSSVALSADGNTAAMGGYGTGSMQGGTWVFTRSGGVWTQQGNKLFGSGAIFSTAGQGKSIALSADGNTLLVGGYMDNYAAGTAIGCFWAFTRTAGVWSQQGPKLVSPNYTAGGDVAQGSGVALSADGNTALIGGFGDNNRKGAAWVWTRSGGVWTQQSGKLVGTGASTSSEQGYSVALSADGNTALVGGYMDVNVIGGGVWVYKRSGTTWAQEGSRLNGTGNSGGPEQGIDLALSADGTTMIVGGYGDGANFGATWVFTTTPVALPLNWLSVEVQVIAKKEVKVSWTTTAEVNTAYFEVQRSTENSNGQYISIGTVPANNTSNTANSYTLTDQYTFVDGTYYYYRIKQVDIDGRFTYSVVKPVKFNSGQESVSWQVYPNPVSRHAGISLTAVGGGIQPNEVIQVELTNSMGQVIYRFKDVVSGVAKSMNERLRAFNAGVYTIVIRHKGETQAVQLVVR